MTRNIASDEKWIFEVRGGVLLVFGERTDLADGWWFSTNDEPFGPFDTDQAARDAAAAASDETAETQHRGEPQPRPASHRPRRDRSTLWRGETD